MHITMSSKAVCLVPSLSNVSPGTEKTVRERCSVPFPARCPCSGGGSEARIGDTIQLSAGRRGRDAGDSRSSQKRLK
jgi:hypothetical protein